MPKNKGAGGKNRRKGKGYSLNKRELEFKQDGEVYAQILRSLGGDHMEVACFTEHGKVTKQAHIRGKMRKKVWMTVGDIVLVSIRDFQDDMCDIILKYTQDEIRILKSQGELPTDVEIKKNNDNDQDISIDFENDNEENHEQSNKVAPQNKDLSMPESDSDQDNDIKLDDL